MKIWQHILTREDLSLFKQAPISRRRFVSEANRIQPVSLVFDFYELDAKYVIRQAIRGSYRTRPPILYLTGYGSTR